MDCNTVWTAFIAAIILLAARYGVTVDNTYYRVDFTEKKGFYIEHAPR